MKWTLILAISFCSMYTWAQRDLTPGKRRDAFGTRDFRNLANYGLQLQVGATYLMTKDRGQSNDVLDPGFRGTYMHDPYGRLGAYAEIGMFHFPKRFVKLPISKKKRIVLNSYWDWGIGFKYFRGGEDIVFDHQDQLGNSLNEETQSFNFSNGNIYARISMHKNIYFKSKRRGKSNFFLDNSLGFNVDYRLLTNSDNYDTGFGFTASEQRYYKPLHVQMHYGLGFGFKLKRGSYLIPGLRAPILGYQATVNSVNGSDDKKSAFGKPSMHWYTSRYWPLLIHVKYMFAFEKKNKGGCPPVEINSQDRDTQQNR